MCGLTYRDLKLKLSKFSEEQLDMDVLIFDAYNAEIYECKKITYDSDNKDINYRQIPHLEI